jgi:hypothetical protein
LETIERVAGLDVHKAQVTACVRVPAPAGGREQHLAEFSTTVRGLMGLRDCQERRREANRLHKALEDTGIKLDCVATDILGKSGRAMLDALIGGTTDPEVLAELAKGKLRAKSPPCARRSKAASSPTTFS